MVAAGIPAKLRSYAPALIAYGERGEVDKAFEGEAACVADGLVTVACSMGVSQVCFCYENVSPMLTAFHACNLDPESCPCPCTLPTVQWTRPLRRSSWT